MTEPPITHARERLYDHLRVAGEPPDAVFAHDVDVLIAAVGKAWARYRPCHDEECEVYECANCGHWGADPRYHGYGKPCDDFASKPCSCGLDELIAALTP